MKNFCCPNCHFELVFLKEERGFLVCKNINCSLAIKRFPLFYEIPVLIPFGAKNCILEKTIERNFINFGIKKRAKDSKLKVLNDFIRNFLIGSNIVSIKNYQYLLQNLKYKNNVLIVGGGTVGSGSDKFFLGCKNNSVEIESIDIYFSKNITAIADAHYLPFKDNKFDLVIIQAVLEHVINPNKVVSEISRVLKKGGIIYAETPFMQNVHEGAYDFSRFSHSGHRYLFKDFYEIESGYISGAFSSVLFISSYAISGLLRNNNIGKVLRLLLSRIFRILDGITPDKFNYDVGCGFYFIGKQNLKSKDNINLIDLPKYYRGGQ